jgi:hypothetical protein
MEAVYRRGVWGGRHVSPSLLRALQATLKKTWYYFVTISFNR